MTTQSTVDLINQFRKRGGQLWSANGQLHFKAPKGALTREELESLRASRDQIIDFLDGTTDVFAVGQASDIPSSRDRAPLTYSQLSHWNWLQLDKNPTVRHVASATRLCGHLNVDKLRSSIAELVRHHAALRTRVVICDGVPTQEVPESAHWNLSVYNLETLSMDAVEREITRSFGQLILEPIDVSVGPLFGVALLRIRDDESVLLVVMDHMISDAFSLNIFLRDLFEAYEQALSGESFSLRPVHMPFIDHAIEQRLAQDSWIQKHAAYWRERLAGCEQLRFPRDHDNSAPGGRGWESVSLMIDKEMKAALTQWSRNRGTTVVMSVFTAYAGLILRWCRVSETILQFQIDGRSDPRVANTIGYLASTLYLRVQLRDDDSFIDLMDRTMAEYCTAHEHADSGYLKAQVPRPEFARTSTFNWVPQPDNVVSSGAGTVSKAIAPSPLMLVNPALRLFEFDRDPITQFFDSTNGIGGQIHYATKRNSVGAMRLFSDNLLLFIQRLLTQPSGCVSEIELS